MFEQITQEGEAVGLYENTRRIGFRQNWLRLIASKGYYLDAEGRLRSKAAPVPDVNANDVFVDKVERHRTANQPPNLKLPFTQKYCSQAEFARYLEDTLDTNAVAVGQGIFIVFKDKHEEQRFLLGRQSIRRDWRQLTQRSNAPNTIDVNKLYERHKILFDDFWGTTLNLGRVPANSEFEFSEQLRRVAGSHKKALAVLTEIHRPEVFEEAEQMRKNDLTVYFALGLFGRRKAYATVPESLKRDVKAFFGLYTDAMTYAKDKLFSVGNPDLIEMRSVESHLKLKTGQLEGGHSWTFHRSHLNDLPAELHIYVGCIIGIVFALNLLGDTLRDALNPLLRKN